MNKKTRSSGSSNYFLALSLKMVGRGILGNCHLGFCLSDGSSLSPLYEPAGVEEECVMSRCALLAQNGHSNVLSRRPLSGEYRTSHKPARMSADDPSSLRLGNIVQSLLKVIAAGERAAETR
jgi:hypothetical protein